MIEFLDNVARKRGPPHTLALEVAKTRAAMEIGDSTGAFYVPRVLRHDPEAGVIDFERMSDLVPLAAMAGRRDTRLHPIMRRAGQALALVHTRLVLPPEMRIPLPPEWMRPPAEHVFVHGDFSFQNVACHEPTNRLVILDWSIMPFLNTPGMFGPKYFDVVWFVVNLFHYALGRLGRPLFARKMADVFLDTYGNQPGGGLDRALFRTFQAYAWRPIRRSLPGRLATRPWLRRIVYHAQELYVQRAFMAYEPACFRRQPASG